MHSQSKLGGLATAKTLGVLAVGGVLAIAAPAAADFILIQSNNGASTEGLGAFTGSINYEFNGSQNYWELTITLTNTSPAANGGFITGVIFNIDSSDSSAAATLASATHTFQNAPNQNGAPFGSPFRAGAALGGDWTGGGSPNAGVAVGQTGTFNFQVAASDVASLTASDFMHGPFQHNFVVRFRGFNDDGSDKVPGQEVPGPAVLTAIAIGLMFPIRRRRRN